MTQTDIYIPKAITQYALTNKCVPQLRLYEYLKMSCSGKRRLSKAFIKKACNDLAIARSTFYRLLSWLKSRKWVTKSHSGYWFIISHENLLKKEDLKGNTAAQFSRAWFNTFKAFCSGSVIGYLVKHQQKAERKKGRSNKPRPVATSALSQILNVPQSTAYKLKQIASTNNFIDKFSDYDVTGVPSTYYREFTRTVTHKVKAINGMLVLPKPDLCNPNLKYKTMRY